MKVFNAILGIFAIFASVYAIWFPGMSFLKIGWVVTVLLCAWGVCALFEAITKKPEGTDSKMTIGRAVLALLGGIGAAIISLIAMFRPGISLIVDLVAIWIFIIWLISSGISSMISAVKVIKPTGNKMWIFSLILGILTLFAGLYGVFHMIAMAQTIGILIGALLMIYGIRMLASVFEQSK